LTFGIINLLFSFAKRKIKMAFHHHIVDFNTIFQYIYHKQKEGSFYRSHRKNDWLVEFVDE